MAKNQNITSEVFQIGGSGFTSQEDAAIYLIDLKSSVVLVDAGCGKNNTQLFKNISSCGVAPENIEYLLITHCHFDHTGGAQDIKEKTKCKIVAHELDAVFLEKGDNTVTAAKWYGASIAPLKIDLKIKGSKEDLLIGNKKIEAIHIPGHSPGSMAYLLNSDGKKVLFAQDVHGPLDASILSNKNDYQQSLKLLLSLDADILCEGHYGVFYDKEEIEDFIQSFL